MLVVGLIFLAQAGATPRMGSTSSTSRAVDQINSSSLRPMPAVPRPTGAHPSDVWVPDRIVPVPDQPGGAMVPGHWERRLSDHQHYVPPLTATTPDGRVFNTPAGVMPPPQERRGP